MQKAPGSWVSSFCILNSQFCIFHFLCVLCASAVNCPGADAQVTPFRWAKVNGAEKVERVFPSAVDPNTVFVWTRGGLLVSKDNGKTFAARGKDLAAQLGSVTALLVNPVHPSTIYAGTLEKGVLLSEDEGATWRALGGVEKGLAGLRIHTLLFSVDDPTFTTLYATHSPQVPGISMSIDGGRTWRAFAMQFGAGDLILAGTTMFFAGARLSGGTEAGFYRSIDAGKNWYRILNVEAPTVLAASRTNPRRAWCGTQTGLFVTDNLGVSTYPVGPQTGMNIVSISADFAAGGAEQVVVYDPNTEGVLSSTDSFRTWQQLNEGLYVGDWVADGAMMAAAGSTLFVCVNGTLFRGAAPAGPAQLSSIHVQPAAAVAGEDGVTFTCRATPGTEVVIDLSPVGGAAATPLLDDGQNGDGAAGDGVFGARLENVPPKVLEKARDSKYEGPRLPGTLALDIQAKAGGATESSFALLTVLQPAANVTLWNGEHCSDLTVRGEEAVGLDVCRDHPYSGCAHLRLRASGPGLAGLTWRQPGKNGCDDTRFHKFFTFCISSETEGPSDLRVMLRDDGANYDLYNAQSSNQLKLAQYLPRLTKQYQRVAIPMADFILGATARPERIRELVFIVPRAETRTYDMDDVGLAVKAGPLLSECAAVLGADPATVLLSARASSAGGKPQRVKAHCLGKEFQLHDDPQSGEDCYALRVPVAQIGTGTRTFRFAACDNDGATEEKVVAFVPRRAPGQIACARGEVKLDGNLEKFADVAPFVVGGGKLELRGRLLYDKHNLYAVVEVKDAAYNPQPPGKGQKKLPPEKLAESSSAELIITAPASATYLERSAIAEADHRFVFVMDEKEGLVLRGRNRLPAKGTRTENGYTIEVQIPLDQLRTRKDPCDFQFGKSTRIEWRLTGADGTKLAWAAPSAEASENPETWGLACFTAEASAPRISAPPQATPAAQAPGAAAAEKVSAACTADVTVEKAEFTGWKGAWRVSNRACEMVLVPQISRVLSFRLQGGQNVLWVNAGLAGQTVPGDDKQWHNFGGDKVWPTEQGLWKKYTGRAGWPPPYWFDCAAGSAEAIPAGVRLRMQKDPQFGAVCVREFVMDAQKPLLLVRQYYEKAEGPPVEMTLWTITQVRKPEFAMLPLGEEREGRRYRKLNDLIEPLFSLNTTVLNIRNDDTGAQKVGVVPDAAHRDGWVAGVYADAMFVQSRRLERDGAYPDGGCHAELFLANRSNGHYVELELLSPLRELKAGEKLISNQVWQLVPCTAAQVADPEKAAVLARAAHRAALEALGR